MVKKCLENFVPQINPERNYTKEVKYKDLMGYSFEQILSEFNNRILGWFINPVDELTDEGSNVGHYGFPTTMACCVLIDLLCQYREGLERSTESIYRNYLGLIHVSFNHKLSKTINSVEYKNNLPYEVIITDLAHAFYHGFRCGIIHNAKIMEYGRINGDPKIAPDVIQERKWDNEGTQIEVAVNPGLLFKVLKYNFQTYLQELGNKKNTNLRENFAKRFKQDTGIVPEWK